DPIATNINFHNNVVGIFPNNLLGTFNVNNGSNAVTATVSQTAALSIGSTIIFSAQPGFPYQVATVAGTAITLTAFYSGTSSVSTTAYLPNNSTALDPLGLGPFGANIASPPYITSYTSSLAAQNPTKLLVPLKRNNYYVNGSELEQLGLDIGQVLDGYGDGYWVGTVQNYTVGAGHLATTYRVYLNLTTSRLELGKTL